VYLRLLRLPGVGRLVAGALIARLPISMVATAEVLMVERATGSFAVAGLVTAFYAVASAAGAPLTGRLIDRLGQTRILVPCAAGYAAALWGLVAATQGGAPTGVLCALAAVTGALIPSVSASMRALWPSLVAASEVPLPTAFAFESVMVEAFFILGPLVAGAIVALASPAAAVAVAGGLALAGTLAFATSPESRAWQAESTEHHSWAGALRAPGIRALALATLPFGAAFGALSVALPAFTVHEGSPGAVGLLWAAQAVGSAAGGLWYGSRTWSAPLPRRYALLYAAFALGLAPLVAAGSLPVLLVLIAVGGVALAPVTAAGFELTDGLALTGTHTEAFTWVVTANVAGSAAGAAVAGAVVQGSGSGRGFVLAFALAATGALLGAALVARSYSSSASVSRRP
jgi:hypothetical protein